MAITCLILSSLSAQQQALDEAGIPYITVSEMFTSPFWTNEMRWAYAMGALDTGRTLRGYFHRAGLMWQGDLLWNRLFTSMQDNLRPYSGQITTFTQAIADAAVAGKATSKSKLPALYIFLLPWKGQWVWGNYEVAEDDPSIIEY